jgi:hypothetical protein
VEGRKEIKNNKVCRYRGALVLVGKSKCGSSLWGASTDAVSAVLCLAHVLLQHWEGPRSGQVHGLVAALSGFVLLLIHQGMGGQAIMGE